MHEFERIKRALIPRVRCARMVNVLTPQTGERMMETSLWDSPSSSSDPRLSFSFHSYSRSSTFSFCVLKRLRHGVSHLRLILYYNVRRTRAHTHAHTHARARARKDTQRLQTRRLKSNKTESKKSKSKKRGKWNETVSGKTEEMDGKRNERWERGRGWGKIRKMER